MRAALYPLYLHPEISGAGPAGPAKTREKCLPTRGCARTVWNNHDLDRPGGAGASPHLHRAGAADPDLRADGGGGDPDRHFPHHRRAGDRRRLPVRWIGTGRNGQPHHGELRAHPDHGGRQCAAHRKRVDERLWHRENLLPAGCRSQQGLVAGGCHVADLHTPGSHRHQPAPDHRLQRLDRAGAADRLFQQDPVGTADPRPGAEHHPPPPYLGARRRQPRRLWRQVAHGRAGSRSPGA